MKRILFLVDTKSLGEQAEREFLAYTPNDDNRSFAQLYGVRRLNSAYIPNDIQICISTIQRMYSILKGEEMDESAEEESIFEQAGADTQAAKEVVYNEKYPPEFSTASSSMNAIDQSITFGIRCWSISMPSSSV